MTRKDIQFRTTWDMATFSLIARAFYKGKRCGIVMNDLPTNISIEHLGITEEKLFQACLAYFVRMEDENS